MTSTSPYAAEPAPPGVQGPGLSTGELLPLLELPQAPDTCRARDNPPAGGTAPQVPETGKAGDNPLSGGTVLQVAPGPGEAKAGTLPGQASGSMAPGGTLPDVARSVPAGLEAGRVMQLASTSPSLGIAYLQQNPITGALPTFSSCFAFCCKLLRRQGFTFCYIRVEYWVLPSAFVSNRVLPSAAFVLNTVLHSAVCCAQGRVCALLQVVHAHLPPNTSCTPD